MKPRLLTLAQNQALVFSAIQAERAGVATRERRDLVSSRIWRELRHGIYTLQGWWDQADDRGRHRIELAGALLIRGWNPDSPTSTLVGGHRTAAFLHGLPFAPPALTAAAAAEVDDLRDLTPESRAVVAEIAAIRRGEGPRHVDLVSADRGRRTSRNGVEVRPATLPAEHVVVDRGVPLTTTARTAVDLMREDSEVDGLIAADGALHLGVPRDELRTVATFCSAWTNGQKALDILAFADGLSESAAESLARWVCAQEEQVPRPELQVELFDAFGLIGRVDLFFRAFRVVVEVDGYLKYTDPWCGDPREAMRRQEAREARLRRAGYIVVRTTWRELRDDPAGFLARLLAAFAKAAA
ncbi:type IV toxin-antitoxin system AbiEi family antitoxin domain-containing protein [Sporichthya brevicatena]|uniref:Type IV toxin-antitoxin system AbiEi family antitoxin domain-containing protein n=1 Tax=Sporichthya brevicatena TaxID=171442 RepID=A0ABP3RCQ0_9ACTN